MSNRQQLSILVVDDMKFNCEFIRRALVAEGYDDIRVADSAIQAIELMQQQRADVLLADWVMPEMDGLELTERVRKIDQRNGHYTCIVILTARDDTASVIEAFERGVDDYLTKPPNKQELAARIHAAGRISLLHNKLLEELEEEKKHRTIDPLTKLGTSIEAERRLHEQMRLVESRGGGICCAVLQIQEAQALVKRYGKVGYQDFLQNVAKRLRRAVRPGDLLARLNDTSFFIGMYFAEEDQIRVKHFKRVMMAINSRPFNTRMGFIDITVAMGMRCQRQNEAAISAAELIKQARGKLPLSVSSHCNEVGV